MARYDPLFEFLCRAGDGPVTLTFDEIEALVGPLPASASNLKQWWENEPSGGRHVQARAWLNSGRHVERVDPGGRIVGFSAARWRRGSCRSGRGDQSDSDRGGAAFDLNVGNVLEHWTVPFGIRELIANALDESVITGTADPIVVKDGDHRWHIRDFGRGVEYQHLTQNESSEKRRHPGVIGQFGMGLKQR